MKGLLPIATGAALITLASSANALGLHQSLNFEQLVSANNANNSFSTSINLNTMLSSMLGETANFTSGQYIVNSGYFSVSYEREVTAVDFSEYTFQYGYEESLRNAGPRSGTYNGTDYSYVVEFEATEYYYDLTGTNNQEASINFAGNIDNTSFWSYFSEENTVTTLESSNFPSNTSGLLEEHYLTRYYEPAGNQGYNYFDINNNLVTENGGILDFDFTALSGEILLTNIDISLSFSENPNWMPTPSVSQVPVPAAAYLFGSALLALVAKKRKA